MKRILSLLLLAVPLMAPAAAIDYRALNLSQFATNLYIVSIKNGALVTNLTAVGTNVFQYLSGNAGGLTNIQEAALVFPAADPVAGLWLGSTSSNTAAWLALPVTTAPLLTNSFGVTVDGAGSAVTTGIKGYIQVPYACTIIKATMMADQNGGCGINVWRTNSASFPPSSVGKISANASPVLTADDMSQDSTLTGWTTALNAYDFIGFNVESNATITRVTLQITVTHAQ